MKKKPFENKKKKKKKGKTPSNRINGQPTSSETLNQPPKDKKKDFFKKYI